MKQNKPFFRGKTRFFWFIPTQTKTNKKQTKTPKKQRRRVYGKWGGPKGHLTWPLNPSNRKTKAKTKEQTKPKHLKQNKQKTKQKQNKTIVLRV